MPDNYIRGDSAKLYYGYAGTALGSLTELTNVKDLNVALERNEADVTTRANAGWSQTAPTLRNNTLEFEMVAKPSDAAVDAILATYLGTYGSGADGETIQLAALDGDRSTSGTKGINAEYCITNVSRSEPIDGVITYSVTAKLVEYTEWVAVG